MASIPNNPLNAHKHYQLPSLSRYRHQRHSAQQGNRQLVQHSKSSSPAATMWYFSDVAVGGTVNTNVSESIDVRLARFNAAWMPKIPISTTKLPGLERSGHSESPRTSFGAVDIVGMPAMAGKVVVIDSAISTTPSTWPKPATPAVCSSEVSLRTPTSTIQGQPSSAEPTIPEFPPAIFTSSSAVPISAASPRSRPSALKARRWPTIHLSAPIRCWHSMAIRPTARLK